MLIVNIFKKIWYLDVGKCFLLHFKYFVSSLFLCFHYLRKLFNLHVPFTLNLLAQKCAALTNHHIKRVYYNYNLQWWYGSWYIASSQILSGQEKFGINKSQLGFKIMFSIFTKKAKIRGFYHIIHQTLGILHRPNLMGIVTSQAFWDLPAHPACQLMYHCHRGHERFKREENERRFKTLQTIHWAFRVHCLNQ